MFVLTYLSFITQSSCFNVMLAHMQILAYLVCLLWSSSACCTSPSSESFETSVLQPQLSPLFHIEQILFSDLC